MWETEGGDDGVRSQEQEEIECSAQAEAKASGQCSFLSLEVTFNVARVVYVYERCRQQTERDAVEKYAEKG